MTDGDIIVPLEERIDHLGIRGLATRQSLKQSKKRKQPVNQLLDNNSNNHAPLGCAALSIFCVIILVFVLMWGLPIYNVWRSELQGKAELVRAEQNRQIKIEEAKANLEAEKLNAEAEVERARGAARAIEIENGKLTDRYIKYLAVRTFNTDNAKFVYIPTECGIVPWLLESGRGPKIDFPLQNYMVTTDGNVVPVSSKQTSE